MSLLTPALPDQAARDQFRNAIEANFSVIAPAGVGKTTSIVERVLAIAEADRFRPADPVLPKLVVVTYTNKAADEMFTRVRQRLDQARPHPEVHAHLAQAFFGTIHSFCQRLLLLAGPLCGLPGQAEVATDGERLWREFLLEEPDPLPALPEDFARAFAIHGQWSDVFTLASNWPPSQLEKTFPRPGVVPEVDASEIRLVEPKGSGKRNIRLSQENVELWLRQLEEQREAADPMPCPEPEMAGSAKPLLAAWASAFQPLRQWRREASAHLAASVAAAFARYRRRSGQLSFDDLVQLAARLLRDPAARELLRGRGWRIILDEAQDTDPTQFVILTELAREPGASGTWLEGAAGGPRPGHFCMVGDPQQSIYSARADLGRYLEAHRRLVEDGGCDATFSVTMRCPVAVVRALNGLFPQVLKRGSGSQVDYVPLEHPFTAASGQVIRQKLPDPPESIGTTAPERLSAYAREFANWWKSLNLKELRASSWDQVAILCPRNTWLDRLGFALREAGVPVQQLSRRGRKAEDPVHAWYAAVLHILAYPRDAFEIYGVLRDILGFSDEELVQYIHRHRRRGQPHPLRLDADPKAANEKVGNTLAALCRLRREALERPLVDAVDRILEYGSLEQRLLASGTVEAAQTRALLARFRHELMEAENAGSSFREYAEACRSRLGETLDESHPDPDAVVLLTAHKSKGLGFETVVLPAFFHHFDSPPPSYPECYTSSDGELDICFDGRDRDRSETDRSKLKRREETERLLYVAMTRVKQTLVIFDDEAWWSDLRKQGEAFGKLLGVEAGTAGHPVWNELPRTLTAKPEAEQREPSPAGAAPSATGEGRAARPVQRPLPGLLSWRHVTPSSLQRHDETHAIERTEPEDRLRAVFPEPSPAIAELYRNDPAAYGNWWHDMMEEADWACGEDVLRIHLFNALKECPDPIRGTREIASFLESGTASRLLSSEWEVMTELPFLWGDASEKVGYEGFIDLLALHRESGAWMILDWKTDRLDAKDFPAAMRSIYGPQIEVYQRVLASASGTSGETGLYSTVTGEWIRI